MPLVRADYSVPLTAGIDQYADPRQAEHAVSESLNVYSDKLGRIKPRLGLEEVSSSAAVDDKYRDGSAEIVEGHALIPWGNEPLIVGRDDYVRTVNGIPAVSHNQSGAAVFGRIDDSADTEWAVLGESSYWATNVERGPSTSVLEPTTAFARIGDVELWAWAQGRQNTPAAGVSVAWALRNVVTGMWYGHGSVGASYGPVGQLYAGVATESASSEENFLLVAYSTVKAIAPADGAVTAATAPLSTVHRAASFCQGTEGSKKVVLCATDNAGTLRLTKIYGDGTTARVQDTNVALNDATDDYLAVYSLDTSYIAVARWARSTGVVTLYVFPNNYGAAEPAITSAAAMTAWCIDFVSLACAGAGHAALAYSGTTGTHGIYIAATGVNSTFVGVTEICTVEFDSDGPSLTARASITVDDVATGRLFIFGGKMYMPAHIGHTSAASAASDVTGNRLAVVELRTGSAFLLPVVAGLPIAQDNAGLYVTEDTHRLRHAAWVDDDGVVMSTRMQARIVGVDTNAETPLVLHSPVAVHITETNIPCPRVLSGNDVVIGGPVIRHVDGHVQELGFVIDPEIAAVTADPIPGLTGTFNYQYMLEWTDRLGQRHRSVPSEGRDITLANERGLVYIVKKSLIEQRSAGTAESTSKYTLTGTPLFRTQASGTTHNRVETAPEGFWGWSGTVVADSDSDASLQDNEILYTEGGIVPNSPPPSGSIMLAHLDRVFIVPDADRTTIWPSHKRVAGVGLTFSAEMVLTHPDGGVITALAALDDYVVVFKKSSVYVFSGDGPNQLNVGGFSSPQRITSENGCVDANSVVSFPGGVLFKSSSGWQLLDRALNVTPIGVSVQDYNAFAVRRVFLVPHLRQLRIVHDRADTDTDLIFDYVNNAWTQWREAPTMSDDIVDGIAINGVVYYLDAAGKLWKETATSGQDDGHNPLVRFASNWITNSVVDFERIWRVKINGEFPGSGAMLINHYYDYSSSSAREDTVDFSALSSDHTINIRPPRGSCAAYKIVINFEGAFTSISKVVLELGKQPGRANRTTAPYSYEA
jgi:hypothetical protein